MFMFTMDTEFTRLSTKYCLALYSKIVLVKTLKDTSAIGLIVRLQQSIIILKEYTKKKKINQMQSKKEDKILREN